MMTHEDIAIAYTRYMEEMKENIDVTLGIYTKRTAEINQAIAELQGKCDHDAAPEQFVHKSICPFCRAKLEDR